MAQIERIVEEIIQSNKIAVFSKTYCHDGAAIQQYLLAKTGQRTVPNIFINQKHVGGCDDLMQAISSGNINQLLKA
ncbi:hypothetical protein RO3G_01888 [Rhizopus delemar RA 99-880]|uniref:Glutaredoxin domain-containing protein n=1 Tax=Rhizopus delemar (strain RA 99-880 / ATCC MYA-4621 / FGSC 9543 / NRRL 43880) TaxID=246409 RepID=I1BLV4_RHIO9|nr:hypothetical protein RO3G_01888 [Rhizopus delemar RA 99-880]|eukprot:EIE77184.1 hypothetical protein RO3G_01888 [Rhizopus delemar RA 99-880]